MIGKVRSEGTRRALRDFGDELDQRVQRAVANAASGAERAAKGTTKFRNRSGELRRRTTAFVKNGTRFTLINRTKYALFVEGGTKAHYIVPKRNGGMLRFRIGGRWISKAVVHHPGTKATHFMRDAVHSQEAGIRAAISEAIDRFRR